MMLVFLFLVNIVLFTRLFWIFSDDRIPLGTLVKGLLIQLLALLFLEPRGIVQWLGVGVILTNILTWLLEWKAEGKAARLGTRPISLCFWLLLFGCLCGDQLGISFNGGILQVFNEIQLFSGFLETISLSSIIMLSVYFTGVLLAVCEGHTVVRLLLLLVGVQGRLPSKGKTSDTDEEKMEDKRGRVIGALERLIIFILVLQGAYGGMGFLMAAKGMTRFKQIENRDFAEYFLIGTLASVITAGAAAFLVKFLIGGF